MIIHKIQEDFAEILNTRGVPIEDQSDRISKSLLKADYMHFESGCSRYMLPSTLDLQVSSINPKLNLMHLC